VLLKLTSSIGIVRCGIVIIVVTEDIEHRETERLQTLKIVRIERHILVDHITEHHTIDIAIGYCCSLLSHIAIEVLAHIERVVGNIVVARRPCTRLRIGTYDKCVTVGIIIDWEKLEGMLNHILCSLLVSYFVIENRQTIFVCRSTVS